MIESFYNINNIDDIDDVLELYKTYVPKKKIDMVIEECRLVIILIIIYMTVALFHDHFRFHTQFSAQAFSFYINNH